MSLLSMAALFLIVDPSGIYGAVFHYAFVIAFVGSAFMLFLYLWKIKRLDMDEEPKFQMLRDEEDDHHGK